MKVLKKISLVYTLQVLAVILLFSYAGISSGKETKESVPDVILPSVINKAKLLKTDKDAAKTRGMNIVLKTYPDISR